MMSPEVKRPNWDRLYETAAGQSAFSVLLFQDIAVIPALALLPLMAPHQDAAAHGSTMLADLPACVSTDELDTGKCLVSEELLAQARKNSGMDGVPGGWPQPR